MADLDGGELIPVLCGIVSVDADRIGIGAQSRIPAPGLAPVEAKKTKSASSDRRRAANQARGLSVRRESSPGQKRSIIHR